MAAKKATAKPEIDEAKTARKWRNELQAAGRREKEWRKEADEIVKRYRGEAKKKHRYNVLWANTETLRPAYYNAKPNPDVRRRFRDTDALGKATGEVLERSLAVFVDGEAVDASLRADVFDALLCGRGISRIKYVPKLAEEGQANPVQTEGPEDVPGGSLPVEDSEGTYEQVEYEQAVIEHVDWKDYRQGYGRVWEEVPWVAFRHQMSQSDAEKVMPAADLAGVEYTPAAEHDEERKSELDGSKSTSEKVAEFWEVWDQDAGCVFFLHDKVDKLIYPSATPNGEPPLEFEGFFPNPQPLQLVEDTGSLIPIPPFRLYQEQAEQLDKISARIDKIVDALRVRAVYDASVSELSGLVDAGDNDMIPTQNAKQWMAAGGLDKAIAWMPVEQLQKVLGSLYDARDRQKAIIDELAGITDLQRGATDPNETYGAQQIKANYGSIRTKRPQDEVKRYARALVRLAGQVMCAKFAPETFGQMTDLKFPTAQQKALLQQQIQASAQQMPMQPGQPPVPDPRLKLLQVPSWEDIIGMMRSPAMFQFRIDVETDSMIAGTLQSDMAGMAEVLKAVTMVLQGLAPMVIDGALPVDAAKELVMAVVRRARLGLAVEDAFDKMQAPKPQQGKQDGSAAAAQANAASKVQSAQIAAQSDERIEGMRQQAENQRLQFEHQYKLQREQFMEQAKGDREAILAKFDAMVKILVATISATKAPDAAVQPTADSTVVGGVQ